MEKREAIEILDKLVESLWLNSPTPWIADCREAIRVLKEEKKNANI